MAVTLTKKFWNGTEYKSIAKIVFTSPNFTSPYTAGTRSHMQPGGKYMGTWYEAVDFMYRQKPNQDYADFPIEMESFFGKLTAEEVFDFANDTVLSVSHTYGEDYPLVAVGSYPNILYWDKDNYGTITNSVVTGSGSVFGTTISEVTLENVVGTALINDWMISSVSGTITTTVSGNASGDGSVFYSSVTVLVSEQANNIKLSTLSGTIGSTVSGTVSGTGVVTGEVSGYIFGDLMDDFGISSSVSGVVDGVVSGDEYGSVFGTVSGTFAGELSASKDYLCHQYSDSYINSISSTPRLRRHHGENSVIFSVTFGEAYDCRLTAWDDDTHSTTNNKVLDGGHFKVDAVAYRSNIIDSAHSPTFKKNNNLVFPSVYDLILKGDESYYGDFDLIFAIEDEEYGEYLAFLPRLYNIDDTFIAGSYDFVTTMHYQYT